MRVGACACRSERARDGVSRGAAGTRGSLYYSVSSPVEASSDGEPLELDDALGIIGQVQAGINGRR